MEKEINVDMTIYQKLQRVRKELIDSGIKKTGKNKYQGYDYFQLDDFVPTATRLFDKYGLAPMFSIKTNELGEETAYMVINDGLSNPIVFSCPTANPQTKNQDPIQLLGSKVTYMRRYLYLMALDITEADSIDSRDQEKEVDTTDYATGFQVKKITEAIKGNKLSVDELKAYSIKKPSDVQKLTLEKAEELMTIIEGKIINDDKEEK